MAEVISSLAATRGKMFSHYSSRCLCIQVSEGDSSDEFELDMDAKQEA